VGYKKEKIGRRVFHKRRGKRRKRSDWGEKKLPGRAKKSGSTGTFRGKWGADLLTVLSSEKGSAGLGDKRTIVLSLGGSGRRENGAFLLCKPPSWLSTKIRASIN